MTVHRLVGGLLVGAVAVLAGACEDSDWQKHKSAHFFEPSPPFVGTSPFVGTQVLPTTIGFATVPFVNCPFVAPFTSNFSLVVDQRSGSDLFLDHAFFRFVDGLGLPSPLDLTRPDLVGMFGSTLVPSGVVRTFRFQPQFGCGFVSVPTSVFINMTFVDRAGTKRHHKTSASMW
jgi:hypothetical protein